MELEHAPRAIHRPHECALCEDGLYVLFGGDKVCPDCGYIAGSGDDGAPEHPWFRWRYIRNELFEKEDGGNDRRKVVGSYVHAYENDDGQIVT